MDDPFSPKRYEELEKIRNMPNELVRAEYELCIPPELHLPASFWQKYNAEQAIIGLRACLLLWCATSRRMIPREFQLQATIALISGQDCLVDDFLFGGAAMADASISEDVLGIFLITFPSPVTFINVNNLTDFTRFHT